MSPQKRLYCSSCRRSLSPRAYSLERWEQLDYQICGQICGDCMAKTERQGSMAVPTAFDTEIKIQRALQEREGGREKWTPPPDWSIWSLMSG